ncbi:hypothetical protein DMC47_29285 [Nostoc sp. 3335mG]|nr:hypothetical protein DMC47_29285 [Nostoc sp. 3335mG]
MRITNSFTPSSSGDVVVLPPVGDPSPADEMNHRIANSLQLLMAMVSVEAREVLDPQARAVLQMTGRRIGAIANVHRHLYRSHDAASVALDAYLEELAADLEQGCGQGAAGRRIRVRADAVSVPPDTANSIGILVSELVTNAWKYAYAPDAPGDVLVTLGAMPFGGYRLEVEDRGCGRGNGDAQGSGMGSRLIALMAARLRAAHGWQDARPGTRFVLMSGRP